MSQPGGRIVLLIEDDEILLRVLARALDERGFRVLPVDSAEAALKLLPDVRPDLVITDIFMPGMDGLQLIQQIRAQAPDLKLIAMSGGGRIAFNAGLRMAELFGADAVLAKPFDAEELLAAVDGLLAKGSRAA